MEPRVIEIFWNNILKGGLGECWGWKGELSDRGTPLIRISNKGVRKSFYPRQVSLQLHGKPIFKRVESTCKNKTCLNPDHLVSGDVARFWSKIQKLKEEDGGCWIWIAGASHGGYGSFSIYDDGKIKIIGAPRYSWELANNYKIKTHLLFVCHKCDNPRCVNPDHLFLGTTQENTKDRDDKGRCAKQRGESNAMSKLNESQVKDIKYLLQQGTSKRKWIAALYGVRRAAIDSIANGTAWSHIT